MNNKKLFFNISSKKIKNPSTEPIYQWASKNFDYSKCDNMETPYRTKYSVDAFPFYKQIQDDILDNKIREVYLLKNSRAGGSENILFTPIRYLILNDPNNILYCTGDMKSAANTMRLRFMDGMSGSNDLLEKYNKCKKLDNELIFEDMTLVIAWSKLKSVAKSQGFKYLFLDEFSTFSQQSLGTLLKRGGCYKNSKLVAISSPDPNQKISSEDDVIFSQFKKGNQCEWNMIDPVTKQYFKFEMGNIDTIHGLKWSESLRREDGTWDLNAVKKTAYYVTKYGTKIENKDRLEIVKTGKWIPNNLNGDDSVRSYKITSFISPFPSCDFGNIAVAFLNAKSNKQLLKVFTYEHLAEEWIDNAVQIHEDQLKSRMRYYNMGESPLDSDSLILNNSCMEEKRIECKEDDILFKENYKTNAKTRFTSVDVQKMSLYYMVNEWYDNGDSAILDMGEIVQWDDLETINTKYKVERCVMDIGYEQRRGECLQFCYKYKDIPLMGRDSLKLPYIQKFLDPFEGKVGGGKERNKIMMYEYSSDLYSSIIFNMLEGSDGKKLYMPYNIPPKYQRQIVSMHNVNGEWVTRKGFDDEHLFDCLKMNLVYANIMGWYRFNS